MNVRVLLYVKWCIVVSLCVVLGVLIRKLYIQKYIRTSSPLCPRCNVVVIDIDILRKDGLRCFGEGQDITPNLCSLVRQSAYFTNAFSQSYWTLPSEISTFTSTYPNTHGVWAMTKGSVPAGISTLADQFVKLGYHTYYAGWSGNTTLSVSNGGLHGYEEFNYASKSPKSWAALLTYIEAKKQPFYFHAYDATLHLPYILKDTVQPLESLPKPAGLPLYRSEFDAVWTAYLADHYTEVFTKDTIQKHPEIFEAPPKERSSRILEFYELLDSQNDFTQRLGAWPAYYDSYMQFIDRKNPSDIKYLRMLYDTNLHVLDSDFKPLVEYLLQPEVADHTIVIITSAHGEAFGEHGFFSHESIPYNELYHVPLAIKYPTGIGKRLDAVVENIDLYPTLIHMVSGNVPASVQGVSLAPLLKGESSEAKSFAISINYADYFVIQTKKFALILNVHESEPELYDLKADPMELHSIARQYSDIVREYRVLMANNGVPEVMMNKTKQVVPTWIDRSKLLRNGYF